MDLGPYFMTPLVWLVRVGVTNTDLVYPERLPETPAELIGWFRPACVPRVLIMAAVGACFCLLAYAVYRKRRVETAGSFLAVDWMKPVFKIGLSAGVALAVSAVVCCTMVLLVLFAKVTGCILPILAKKLRLDPAVMASPFITTIVDTVSLLIYFGIAQIILF